MKAILICLFIVSLAVILSATTKVVSLANTNPNAWGIFIRGIAVCLYSIVAISIISWAIFKKKESE